MKRLLRRATAPAVLALGIASVGTPPVAASTPTPTESASLASQSSSECGDYCPDDINTIRIPDGTGGWTATECSMFPRDNVWHSLVTDPGLSATSLSTLPDETLRARFGSGSPYANQAGQSNVAANHGHGINFITSAQTDRPFLVDAPAPGSNETRSEWHQRRPVLWFFDYLVRHESPGMSSLKWQDMAYGVPFTLGAGDNHMYFVDLHSNPAAHDDGASCMSHEYISFNPVVSTSSQLKVSHGASYDLTRNTRRLSSDPTNSQPTAWPGTSSTLVRQYRSTASAQGGSGLPGLPGMIRVDEVFANSVSADTTVRTDGEIDHVLGAVLPSSLIRQIDANALTGFTWPATNSDGTQTDPALSVPMGSRLRLTEDACETFESTYATTAPQAAIIVRAMCRHGLTIIDSAGVFGLYGEMSDKWDATQLSALNDLSLHDFELVDVTPMRKVSGGANCRNGGGVGWQSATNPCNSPDWLAVN